MIVLNEKEKSAIKELQTEEQTCVEKYKKYSGEAKDPVLKQLFTTIQQEEQKHYNSLEQILSGNVPSADCNDTAGKNYNPIATYDALSDSEDKKSDCFLAVDSIGTEKMISSDYNTNVFAFSDTNVRKLLADIQIEEQNHAEMLYKYRMANGMV